PAGERAPGRGVVGSKLGPLGGDSLLGAQPGGLELARVADLDLVEGDLADVMDEREGDARVDRARADRHREPLGDPAHGESVEAEARREAGPLAVALERVEDRRALR